MPRAAIERLAEADAFRTFSADRRQGLWKVRGLGEVPLPLFAAADAREDRFRPEAVKPVVMLRPMTEKDAEKLQGFVSGAHFTELAKSVGANIGLMSELADIAAGQTNNLPMLQKHFSQFTFKAAVFNNILDSTYH